MVLNVGICDSIGKWLNTEEVDTSKTQIIGSIQRQGEKLRWLFTTRDTNQERINFEA